MNDTITPVGFKPGFLNTYITECCNSAFTRLSPGIHVCDSCGRNVDRELYLFTQATIKMEAEKVAIC
jgi:ribosomal protein L37AE/L43A